MNKAITEIRGQDTAELNTQLKDLRKEQFELRFRGAAEGAGTQRRRQIRRSIARILTVLGDRTAQQTQKGGDK